MSISLEDRFRFVSEKIEEEAMAEFGRLARVLCGMDSEPDDPETVRKRTNQEHTGIVSLRALRIQINLELIKNGNRENTNSLICNITITREGLIVFSIYVINYNILIIKIINIQNL